MKKMYQTPEIEIKAFVLQSDILEDIVSEHEVPTMPPDDLDQPSNYSLKDTIGFGW